MDSVRRFVGNYAPRVAVLIAIWVAVALWVPDFRGTASFYAVLEYLPLLGLISLALMVTMIAGELDLSVASMAAIGGVVAVQVSDGGLVVALVVGTLAGTVFGAIQGWLIGRLAINSLAFTIGSLILLRGVAYVFAGNNPVPVEDLAVTDIFLERWWIFSFSSVVAIGVFVIVGAILAFVRYGRELYAIGGGRAEAVTMGIPLRRPILISFTISGTCAALAGALASMKGGTADPASYFNLLLFGVAAALVGGISLYGGRGTVLNVILGTMLLGVLSAGLTFRGEVQATTDIVTGTVLLLVIALGSAATAYSRSAEARRERKNVEALPEGAQ